MFYDKYLNRENDDNSTAGYFLLVIVVMIIVFLYFVESCQIARLGYYSGKESKITNFPNLNGVLFALVFNVLFVALIIAGGFCYEQYSEDIYRGNLWAIPFLIKGFLSIHIVLALPLYLFVKIINFFSWVFKSNDRSESTELKTSESNQGLYVIPNEKVTQ